MNDVTTKPVSKADVAKAIFDQVHAEDYDLNGASPRACFIQRAMEEAHLTKNGASTYYQNFMNEARGKKRYSYTPKRKSEETVTKADVKRAEEAVKATVDSSLRWHVVNEGGELVSTHKSRTGARNEVQHNPTYSIKDTAAS